MKRWYAGLILSVLVGLSGLGVYAYAKSTCPGSGPACCGKCLVPH